MPKDLRFALLLDCYGEFLTPRQRDLMGLYYYEDLSLGEIAEPEGVSRQAVRDGIKRGEQVLLQMEEKLGFAARLGAVRENYSTLTRLLTQIAEAVPEQEAVQHLCREAEQTVAKGLELL